MAARIAARSTTHGTPVKSCSTTRAGLNGISTCAGARGLPAGERLHVLFRHLVAVAVAQQRFQQHADRIGQGGHVAEARRLRASRGDRCPAVPLPVLNVSRAANGSVFNSTVLMAGVLFGG